jgi:poly(3-hydroxybutyrate) depolymerase
MNPNNHARSHYDYFQDLIKGDSSSVESHRKFYDEYNAVLDMDANYYLETISTVFQEFKLVNGTWDVKALDGNLERVRPNDITTTALLSVEGELDDISGSGQTAAVHDICGGVNTSMQQHYEVPGAGHYGIFSGRRWRELVYPKVKDFIKSYQPKPAAARPAVTAPMAAAPGAGPAPEPAPVKVEVLEPVKPVAAPVKATVSPVVKPTAKVKPSTPVKTGTKVPAAPAAVAATKPASKAIAKTAAAKPVVKAAAKPAKPANKPKA